MGQERAAGYINAVLRAVDRDRAHLFDRLPEGMEGVSVRTSCPLPLLTLWSEAYGPAMAERLAESANEPPPAYIRINTLKTSESAFYAAAEEAGIRLEKLDCLPACARGGKPGFAEKACTNVRKLVLSSGYRIRVVLRALAPRPENGWPTCAPAPGGKTLTPRR